MPLSATLAPVTKAVYADRVTLLADALATLHLRGVLDDGAFFAAERPDRYTRRLVWRDPRGEFVVIGMTWAPGQGAPLHDHAGAWGAEIVVSGIMEETPYELVSRDPEGRCRFRKLEPRICAPGGVSVLTPPFEYHAFRNVGMSVATTLHVYSGEPDGLRVFAHDTHDWYVARTVELRYDA